MGVTPKSHIKVRRVEEASPDSMGETRKPKIVDFVGQKMERLIMLPLDQLFSISPVEPLLKKHQLNAFHF